MEVRPADWHATSEWPCCVRTVVRAIACPARAKLVYLSLLDGPVSAEALRAALDLNKLSLDGILRTLSERGLVERIESGAYRARVLERGEDEKGVAEDDRSDPLLSTE